MAPRQNEIIAAILGMCFGILFAMLLMSPAYAADLSTDPADGSGSAPPSFVEEVSDTDPVEPVSSGPDPDPEPDPEDKPSDDTPEVVYDPVPVETEPDTYSDSEDVVVNRADLEEVVALLNDLSAQLALYAADVPAGYEPTEQDLEYRESLLTTLSGIHDSLLVLTEPPAEEPLEEEQATDPADEQIEADASSLPLLPLLMPPHLRKLTPLMPAQTPQTLPLMRLW